MKKMNILLMSISAILHMISCNKETEPDIDDLPNNNFRILKVEQTKIFETPPFANSGGNNFSVIYEYVGDSAIIGRLFKSGDTANYIDIIIYREYGSSHSMQGFDFRSFYCDLGSYLCGINKTIFNCDKTSLQSLSFETRYTFGFGLGGQIRTVKYDRLNNKLSTVKSIVEGFILKELYGDTVGITNNFKWIGNDIYEFEVSDYLGYSMFYDVDSSVVVNLLDKGRSFVVNLQYTVVPSTMPKELIRKVNQALSGIMRGPFEDYVYNWQVDFLYPGNNFLKKYVESDYKEYVERLQSSDKTILADWLWSFAHPSFNVLPEQDKLIASKRITGRKIVDIIDDQPVYQVVDSIATFPYVFDPVAKTLEIAGLKIWYEVLD